MIIGTQRTVFDERVHTAKFFMSVLIQELHPDDVYVFMTEGARAKNEAPLLGRIKAIRCR
ncbi:MAG: hypothetical protein KatS3mg080_0891 [Anoxybacillus sp.]|nr:MAG: hypothetical protein KatS3mg080_0891 [Anoxybacillus sp.]